MPKSVRYRNGVREVVEATPDDVPQDHPLAVEARRAGMVVSPFQAKTALDAAGLLETVEGIIAAADATTQRAWNEAIEFKRTSPTINALAAQLGMTDAEIDALFEAARGIEA